MSVFLLTWNPQLWDVSEEDWSSQIRHLKAGGTYESQWSIGTRSSGIFPGDNVLLLRQAKDRGIVASGTALSVAYKDLHWDRKRAKKRDLSNYVMVQWDSQVEIAERLRTEILLQKFPEVRWNYMPGSGVRVPDVIADELMNYWAKHVEMNVITYPDEVPTYVEGGTKTVTVNRYERSPAARQDCINVHGAVCVVCGFDGRETYGSYGDGLIHVHHLLEISEVGKEYEVNPRTDLRPVCPNCHAMIHRRRPAYSIDEVKKMFNHAKR